jgi:hypothetical protein
LIEGFLPLVVAGRFEIGAFGQADVVHEHVDASELPQRGIDHAFHAGFG